MVIGFGNPDREDDGFAWHVLNRLIENERISTGFEFDSLIITEKFDLIFTLQLTPELCDEIKNYTKVCFVDTHTGDVEKEFKVTRIKSHFELSPLSHHLTPEMLLALCKEVYNHLPEAISITAKGYQFGFKSNLSQKIEPYVNKAIDAINSWISS